MFLDFIVDIAEVGNQVTIRTSTETIEGAIVKLSKELIAIQKTDGSVIIKKDSDISHVEIHPTVTNEIGGKMQTNVSNSNVRSGITLIKNDKVESFTCHICGKSKTSKKICYRSKQSKFQNMQFMLWMDFGEIRKQIVCI